MPHETSVSRKPRPNAVVAATATPITITAHTAEPDAAQLALHMRQNCADTSSLPITRSTLAQPNDEAIEFEQIDDSKKRTRLAHDDLWIGYGEVGPLGWDGADRLLIDLKQEPLAVPVVSLGDASEGAAAERMERVRDPNKTLRSDRTACILYRVTSASSGVGFSCLRLCRVPARSSSRPRSSPCFSTAST